MRTSEGDRVTLSVGRAVQADVTSIAYDRTGRPLSSDLSLQLASAQLDRLDQVKATVEGDLNEQERADLEVLLTHIDKIAQAFFGGELDEAVGRALQIQDLGSLQSFRFDASYSASTTVVRETLADSGTAAQSEFFGQEQDSLAKSLEEFFASILQDRDEPSALSLKALLPPVSTEPVVEPGSVPSVGQETTTPSIPEQPSLSASPAAASPSEAAPAEPASSVDLNSEVPVDGPREPKNEPEQDTEPAAQPESSKSAEQSQATDSLAAFAQQIRERIDESGLADTRLGPYLPSFVNRLIESRISVLISTLSINAR